MKKSPLHFYLYSKPTSGSSALKDMLQFLKTSAPGKSLSFAYVESESSLHPQLSLWENLQVVIGDSSWKEFEAQLEVDWRSLVKLIHDPHQASAQAESWERLIISLLKAHFSRAQHILVDMNEDLHSPLYLMNFKKILCRLGEEKSITIASANTSLWLDSTHTIITRSGYTFQQEVLGEDILKRRSA